MMNGLSKNATDCAWKLSNLCFSLTINLLRSQLFLYRQLLFMKEMVDIHYIFCIQYSLSDLSTFHDNI
jgi:hypothetical protein